MKLSWKTGEKAVFRFFFIYFILEVVPLDWKYYRELFAMDWLNVDYRHFFNLTHYGGPRFFSEAHTYADWAVVAGIALAGTLIWTYFDRNRKEYSGLYHWLRVVLRYRLAVGVIAYGFIKLFPLQAPYPSISHLNTDYGDLSTWKIFTLSLGIVPDYQSLLGAVEIAAGLLLLSRKTTFLGSFIVIAFTGNVVLSNLAYEGGETVYSSYLVLIAVFLLAYDLPRLISLLGLCRPTYPQTVPVFGTARAKNIQRALKTGFILVFVAFYGLKVYQDYRNGPGKYPGEAGLPDASGIYNVKIFRINNDTLPAFPADGRRWENVVFEKWNTISIAPSRIPGPTENTVEPVPIHEDTRKFETEGAGGRDYYRYGIDSLRQTLSLQGRSRGSGTKEIELHYSRPDSNTILLTGLNEDRDSLYVLLEKIDRKYLLKVAAERGRRRPLEM